MRGRRAKSLVGLALSGAHLAADTLVLQFGQGRRGEFALHIQCPYEVHLGSSRVDDVREFFTRRAPLRVLSANEDVRGRLTLEMSGVVRLSVLADASAHDEQWRLFQPGEKTPHLVFGGGHHYEE
jgi:hypothetical protein